MKHLWLVYEQGELVRNSFFIQEWEKACQARGVRLSLILHQELDYGLRDGQVYLAHRGQQASLPDAAVMRLNQPLLSAHLEAMDLPCFNNATLARICNDKRLTHQMMAALFPSMDTLFLRGDEQNSPLPYPVVVKAVHGSGGRQVFLATDDAQFLQALAACAPGPALVQALSDSPGYDLRAYVLGHDIIHVMERSSATDFRSNIGQGGQGRPGILPKEAAAFVRQVIGMFDLGLVGVDFIRHQGQLYFNEIEDAVGTRMLFANGIDDIVPRYLNLILSKI